MLVSLFRLSALPMAIIFAILVLFMARKRISFLANIPIWVFIAAIVLVLLVWAIYLVVKQIGEAKQAEEMDESMERDVSQAGPALSPQQQKQDEEIQSNLKKALATLRNGPHGKKTLYMIPWYMIVGFPQVGKTVALKNSGLNYPGLTKAMKLQGWGGTRNCDWWISTEAIIVDTAGRYMEESREEQDEAAWTNFLGTLKTHRPKRPLNGLLLAYSIEELFFEVVEGKRVREIDENELIDKARILRQRIDEIMDQLGWRFPIYLLFTKSDLIRGFSEYFSPLNPANRKQVWGTTFPVSESADLGQAVQHFSGELDVLAERLREFRIHQLKGVTGEGAWGRALMFPEEFSLLKERLHILVETLLEPNPLKKDQPLFRGAFFTSGMQEGIPIDKVVERLREALGARSESKEGAEQASSDDAYFVKNLFSEILPKDVGLIQKTRRLLSGAYKKQVVLATALAVASLLFSAWVVTSYFRLDTKVRDVMETVHWFQETPVEGHPSLETLQTLNTLREAYQGSWHTWPLTPAESVREEADREYRRGFRERVLSPIELQVRRQLNAAGTDPDRIRLALRTELFLTDPGNREKIGNEKQMTEGVLHFGFPGAKAEGEEWTYLEGFCEDYLDAEEPLLSMRQRDMSLQKGAERLRDSHGKEAYYEGIVAGASRQGKDLKLNDLAGIGQSLLASHRGIPAAYTAAGWEGYVSSSIRDVQDVVRDDNELIKLCGEDPAQDDLVQQDLMDLHVDRFEEEWADFLRSIRLKRPGGRKDESFFKKLKAKNSPLRQLIQGIAAQSEIGWDAKDAWDRSDELSKFLSVVTDFEGAAGEPYTKGLGDLLKVVVKAWNGQYDAVPVEEFLDLPNIADEYCSEYEGQVADAFQHLLTLPASEAKASVTEAIRITGRDEEQQRWSEIWQELRASASDLVELYPFAPSPDVAHPDDVAELFRKDGEFDAAREMLSDDLKAVRPSESQQRVLDAASEIQKSLFSASDVPSADFTLTIRGPHPIDGAEGIAAVDEIVVALNGDKHRKRGADRSINVRWTPDPKNTQCYVELRSRDEQVGIIPSGDKSVWSWFRLLDLADNISRAASSETFVWTFNSLGVQVECEIEMNMGEESPFSEKSTFRSFRP